MENERKKEKYVHNFLMPRRAMHHFYIHFDKIIYYKTNQRLNTVCIYQTGTSYLDWHLINDINNDKKKLFQHLINNFIILSKYHPWINIYIFR